MEDYLALFNTASVYDAASTSLPDAANAPEQELERRRRIAIERARVEALRKVTLHRCELLGGGSAGVEAHHGDPQRPVSGERHRVQVDAVLVQIAEVLAERSPAPLEVARLDEGCVRLHQTGGVGIDRRGGVAAVADHERRDPLRHERREELRLVGQGQDEVAVGVDVDEARADDATADVDDAPGLGSVELPDRGDPPVLDGHIGPEPGLAGAVDDPAVHEEEVVAHAWSLLPRPRPGR